LKLNENLRLNPLYQFHQSRLGISYSILLGESTQMLSQDITIWDEEKKFVELRNGKYYYFIGNFKDFHSALNFIKSQSLKKGTIIQAFYDGEYLDATTIINYVNDTPDLILLMDYNKSLH
ncbi:MAG: hypothetical protein ABIO44_12875, partial [Saprospiraceae bacterium]